jgi:Leucine-rich repeat (LRR) protein
LGINNNNLNDANGVQFLKNLQIANFSFNCINKIDCFDGLLNLNFLDLSNNVLRCVEKSGIGLLPSLKTLYLDNNYLKQINSFIKISSMQYFSISANKIMDFMAIERLSELEFLKELTLTHNPLTKQYNYRILIIRKLPNLNKLDGAVII